MSFVEYIRVPDPATVEVLTVPVLFLTVQILTMLAGFRWHGSLIVAAGVLAFYVSGLASQHDALSPATNIGAAIAALLLIVLWKLRRRRTSRG